jgi:hypothetical protein
MRDSGRAFRTRFWLVAFGALWGIGSAPPVARAEPARPARQKALLIAVQKHDDPRLNLSVTLQDSHALAKTLMERAGIPRGNLLLMNDEAPPEFRPTLVNLRRELRDFFEGAGPDDRLMIYFSGHGVIQDGQTFLVPADIDLKDIARTALPGAEVREALAQCPAKVKFLILDCCQAGGEKALPDPSVIVPQVIAKGLELQRVSGCVVLASCQAQEKSYEWPERHQSVFTYWFCRALEGGADKDGDGRISADEVYEYTFDRVSKTVAQMLGEPSQTPVRQIGVGVVGPTVVLELLPESPESLCARLAAHLDLEIRLRKLKKVGVLEFLEPYGQVEGLAQSSLPAYCAERVSAELTRLAGTSYGVLEGPQFRQLVRGMSIADVGDPNALQRLAQQGGQLDAVISGTLRRRGPAMALTCEMIATSTGDTLASPSGKLPLSESLIADDGFSFDNRSRADGLPFEARVVETVLDQARRPNPLLKSDFPFRVEVVSLQPAPGETIGPTTRRVRKEFVPAKASRARSGLDPNELLIAARTGENFEVLVTNRSDKRVGLALIIDGINTLGQRRQRVENARLWVIDPGKTNVINGWHVPAGEKSSSGGIEHLISKQFVFTDLAHSVAGRQQFGDALGTITAAFFEEKPRATRGVGGVGEGQETLVDLKQVKFLPGRLLGAITIKYVDEDALRNTQPAPSPPR